MAKRGFASMDAARMREVAAQGGRSAHALGLAHEFTSEEARSAGRKGGLVIGKDRAHMAEIGRRGGTAKQANRQAMLAELATIDRLP